MRGDAGGAVPRAVAETEEQIEVVEHEAVRALHERASRAMLLPGAGFGVVPTELAATRAGAARGAPVASPHDRVRDVRRRLARHARVGAARDPRARRRAPGWGAGASQLLGADGLSVIEGASIEVLA
jgi:kynureninase